MSKRRDRRYVRVDRGLISAVGASMLLVLAVMAGLGALLGTGGAGQSHTGLMSVTTIPTPGATETVPDNLSGSDLDTASTISAVEDRWDDDAASTLQDADAAITAWSEETVNATPDMIRYFDGRPVRPVKNVTMKITAYSPDARSCAPFDDGITASGYSVWTNGGKLIAADKRFKFGTLMSVPGYNGGRPTPVLDRGAAIKNQRLDLLFPTHNQARQWGVQTLTVTIWEYIDTDNG